MDMDTFERLSAENRRRGRCFDALIGLEDLEGSDEEEEERSAAVAAALSEEVPCPFCGEEFDGVGLCCHMDDEHPVEANAGVCPICMDKVGMTLVNHITSQHRSALRDKWRNRRNSSGSRYSTSTLALLKKGLQDKNLVDFLGGSSRAAPVSTVPDPLLSSFVGNCFQDLPNDLQNEPLVETQAGSDSVVQKAEESIDEPLLPEVKEERTKRSQFVQGLVLSLMFDDIL